MAFEELLESSDDLLSQMRRMGFSESYVAQVSTELRWLERHGSACESLGEACLARIEPMGGSGTARKVRSIFGLIEHFELHGGCPSPGEGHALFERGARFELLPCFQEVVDSFERVALARGMRESSVRSCVSSASTFFRALQGMGRTSFDDISERDVVSLFAGRDGAPSLSWSYKESVSMVLACGPGPWEEGAERVRTYLPPVKRARKNVQYLTAGEVALIRSALANEGARLCLRDRAVGWILLLTGLRACDIAGMLIGSVAWEFDEVRITQRKTGEPLTLPLLPVVGNAMLDYLERERPESADPHLFLSRRPPHGPVGSTCISNIASKIFDAAGVRTGDGERRGTHIFRHHAATGMVDAGVPRAVVSATLGHADPASLDRYLTADIEQLRTCALSVARYPVREGVFGR